MDTAENHLVKLSILDRLASLGPGGQGATRSSFWEDMREFKASLCRDLAALLNTRRAEDDIDQSYAEVNDSILAFGVADFTSYNLKNSVEQERIRRSIERAIRLFEPRLSRVTVSLEPPDSVKPLLHFQISAMLRFQPGEAVLFDATVRRDSRRVAVSGADS
jgi:type VI secretion system protein ImpF